MSDQNAGPSVALQTRDVGRRLAGTIAALLATTAVAVAQPAAATPSGPLVIERQGSFFVGGREVQSKDLSTQQGFDPAGTITVDQVYVHYEVPTNAGGRYPLTLIHGCCLTGKSWETTPDGRMGWDEYFVRRGYPVYVVDQAWRGRSAADPTAINTVKTGQASADRLPNVFSAGHEAAWAIFRFGPEYPTAYPGLQYPLEAEAELWKQLVPDYTIALGRPNPTVPALSELARKIGGTVLISHSLSGDYPFQTVASNPAGVAGIVAIEPATCPAATGDLKPYLSVPTLVIFGDYVDQSPRWAPRLKACRAFVEAVNQAGGRADLTLLPDVGFHGNSHMIMQDRNSLEVGDWLLDWIEHHVARKDG